MKACFFVSVALLLQAKAAHATQELNAKTLKELKESGKNGMVKFYQPWCGHCTAMKPDWDKLAEEAHPSVFIADVNCSDEDDLCIDVGVEGYPTIKIYRDGKSEDYNGSRSFEELKEFVDTELAAKCSVHDLASCSDKAKAYIAKWKGKVEAEISKEIDRLSGMKDKIMTMDLKAWLRERLAILKQLLGGTSAEKEEL